MREKIEILQRVDDVISRVAPDKEAPLIVEQELIEVLIDIRDIFNNYQIAEARRFGETFDGME